VHLLPTNIKECLSAKRKANYKNRNCLFVATKLLFAPIKVAQMQQMQMEIEYLE
jgi:hypothetical protein